MITLQEHDCKLNREIVELVDREADLLVRGIKEDSLLGEHLLHACFISYPTRRNCTASFVHPHTDRFTQTHFQSVHAILQDSIV